MKKLISLCISLIILALLYWKIDFSQLSLVFQQCDRLWLAVSLSMVVPLTFLSAWRLQLLAPQSAHLSLGEANRLILAASVLNFILPSKMGDVAKAYFMTERTQLSGSLSLSLVVFEKACDMLSLLLWCVLALMVYPQKDLFFWTITACVGFGLVLGCLVLGSSRCADWFFRNTQPIAPKSIRPKLDKLSDAWLEMQQYFRADRQRLLVITLGSVFIWFLHLLQIWLFILALNAWTPFTANLALAPLSILAGLLPFTFAGVGTRDAAIIFFYQPYLSAPVGAALGVLCTSRYLLPALGGLPFLNEYIKHPLFSRKEKHAPEVPLNP